jgi:hypothetical protein
MVVRIICNISCNGGKHDSLDRFKYNTGIICNISCNGGKHDSLDRFKYNTGSIVIYTEYSVSYRWLPGFQLSHTFFRVSAKKVELFLC